MVYFSVPPKHISSAVRGSGGPSQRTRLPPQSTAPGFQPPSLCRANRVGVTFSIVLQTHEGILRE